jgi:hypothetical protein
LKSLLTRHRRLVALAATAVVLAAVHPLLLRGMARLLVLHEPAMSTRYVCLLGGEGGVMGDHAFDWAAEFCRADPDRKVLLIEPYPSRMVEIGVVRSFEAMSRRELQKRGVPPSTVLLIAGRSRDDWEAMHHLGDWLAAHPGEAALACDCYHSRYFRYLLDHSMSPAEAGRAHTLILSNAARRRAFWWRNRAGVKEIMFGWLELLYAWGQGKDRFVPARTSTHEYQELVRAKLGGGAP